MKKYAEGMKNLRQKMISAAELTTSSCDCRGRVMKVSVP
jgi:hypothetical protein